MQICIKDTQYFFFISELMNSDTIRETSLILPIILGYVYFIGKQGLMVIK